MEPPWDSSFPSSHPSQSRSPPPKITYSVKGKEHRTLTHPLCYEVLETWPVIKKKKKNHNCMPHSMAKTIVSSVPPPPPPTSVSIPKKLSIISWSSIRSKAKGFTKILWVIISCHWIISVLIDWDSIFHHDEAENSYLGGGEKSYDDRGLWCYQLYNDGCWRSYQ